MNVTACRLRLLSFSNFTCQNCRMTRLLTTLQFGLKFIHSQTLAERTANLCLSPNTKLRLYSTALETRKAGTWGWIKKQLGIHGKMKYPKRILIVSGYRMYICCTRLVEYDQILKVLQMPDTFNSWFLVTELHIWLCMVRLTQEGREGRFVRNHFVKALWTDVDKRSKQLGTAASMSARRENISELGDQFYALLFSYDEGLLSDDRILAGALWRGLFGMRETDPRLLALMVEYVRKQMKHLEKQESGSILLTSGLVSFLPLQGDQEDKQIEQKLDDIYNSPVGL